MPISREINKDFFKTWSGNMAYVLGFMYADGNIIRHKNGGHFFAIYTADRDLLYEIKACMKSNHKISENMGVSKICYSIQIGSKEMFNDLCILGLTPNKFKRMKLPFIPSKYSGDFVRGFFDGDGNVWMWLKHKNSTHPASAICAGFTSASSFFLKELLMLLRDWGIVGGYISYIKNKACGSLRFGNADSLKLAQIMYNVPHRLFLQRKKSVFEKFKQMRP